MRSSCGLYFKFFLLHATNWNLTKHVIETFAEAKSNFVLVDVSFAEETRQYKDYFKSIGITVLYPHNPLSLAQGMEYIRRISLEWRLDYILYSHNDAHYPDDSKTLLHEANEIVCLKNRETPLWGFITVFLIVLLIIYN